MNPHIPRSLLTPAMIKAGFGAAEPKQVRRVFASVQGREKEGKTHFSLTAPGPIAILSFDQGTASQVAKRRAEGKVILPHYYTPVPLRDRSTGNETQKKTYAAQWNSFHAACDAVVENPKIRTLVVDTLTDLWALARLAEFGRLSQKAHNYVEINAEFRNWLESIYRERPDLNVILIHKVKKEYRKSTDKKGEEKADWTGEYERAGFNEIGYLVDGLFEAGFQPPYVEGGSQYEGYFYLNLLGTHRLNAGAYGLSLTGEECNFQYLAMSLFPESDLADWEDSRV